MSEADRLGGRRILVVEDLFYLADDIGRTLSGAGADVVGPVSRMAEATAISEAEPCDAAVLDINIRGELTFALARRLRARGVPVLFATGYEQSFIPEDLQDVHRLMKPVAGSVLLAAVTGLFTSRPPG